MPLLRQRNIRVRVRKLEETSGEWGGTDKSWADAGTAPIQKLQALSPIEGSRRLERMGAEYSADYHAYARVKPEIKDGWLLETLDGQDNVIHRLLVKKVLPRGRYVSILLEENPNIQG